MPSRKPTETELRENNEPYSHRGAEVRHMRGITDIMKHGVDHDEEDTDQPPQMTMQIRASIIQPGHVQSGSVSKTMATPHSIINKNNNSNNNNNNNNSIDNAQQQQQRSPSESAQKLAFDAADDDAADAADAAAAAAGDHASAEKAPPRGHQQPRLRREDPEDADDGRRAHRGLESKCPFHAKKLRMLLARQQQGQQASRGGRAEAKTANGGKDGGKKSEPELRQAREDAGDDAFLRQHKKPEVKSSGASAASAASASAASAAAAAASEHKSAKKNNTTATSKDDRAASPASRSGEHKTTTAREKKETKTSRKKTRKNAAEDANDDTTLVVGENDGGHDGAEKEPCARGGGGGEPTDTCGESRIVVKTTTRVPLTFDDRGEHVASEGSAQLLREIGGGDVLRRLSTRFYEKFFVDTVMQKFRFESDGADAHGKRLGDWMVDEMGGEGTPWLDSGREGQREWSHAKSWYSDKRPKEKQGRRFKLDDCRIWMRLMFWSARQEKLNTHPVFWQWFQDFIAYYIDIYEETAPPFTAQAAGWSTKEENIKKYVSDGYTMKDVIGFHIRDPAEDLDAPHNMW